MECPDCGAEVLKESTFCHRCGARLGENPGDADFGPTDENPGEAASAPAEPGSAAQRFRNGLDVGRAEEPERDLWEGGYSAKAMAGAWALSLVATAALLALGVWFWSSTALWWIVWLAILLLWVYQAAVFARRRLGVRYRLTSQRFFHESGIFVHTTDLIEVIDMDDITYRQTLIDRFFGVGTIRIVSSDRSHPDLSIAGIEDVKDVAAMMHEARHAERLRRGLHIERI